MKFSMRFMFCAILLLFASTAFCQVSNTNIVKLLGDGKEYAGREVVFFGYVCSNEDSAVGVFLTLQDCHYSNYGNGLKINRPPAKEICNGLARLQGIFRYDSNSIPLDDPYTWGEVEVKYFQCLTRNKKRAKGN